MHFKCFCDFPKYKIQIQTFYERNKERGQVKSLPQPNIKCNICFTNSGNMIDEKVITIESFIT